MAHLRTLRILVVLAIVTLLLLPFQLAAVALRHPSRQYWPHLWQRWAAWALSLKVTVYGQPASNAHGVLLVANHVSWLDIVALGAATPVSFIAKDEVRGWPVAGQLARLQRSVFISRDRRASVPEQTAAIRARLEDGDRLVLFAEGTTSDGNFIYPFKSSLLGAVGVTGDGADGQALVQPVAIAYTHWHGQPMGRFDRPIAAWPGSIELAPHLSRILKEGVLDAVVVFGEPVTVGPGMNRKALTAMLEAEVRAMMSDALRGRLSSSNPY